MRRIVILSTVVLFCALFVAGSAVLTKHLLYGDILQIPQFISSSPSKKSEGQSAQRVGERMLYDIKIGNIYLGKAEFNHVAMVEFSGKPANLVTFKTEMARFTDLEKIYSDASSFLPLRVERFISTWPVPEKIVEVYRQDNFTLSIKKTRGNKQESTVIKKDSVIHNAIMLPFYVRMMPKLSVGWSMRAVLPNQSFQIKLVSIEDITVPAGTFSAYYFSSDPEKFEIWISADSRRMPLKIKGTGIMGYTLVLKEYKEAPVR